MNRMSRNDYTQLRVRDSVESSILIFIQCVYRHNFMNKIRYCIYLRFAQKVGLSFQLIQL